MFDLIYTVIRPRDIMFMIDINLYRRINEEKPILLYINGQVVEVNRSYIVCPICFEQKKFLIMSSNDVLICKECIEDKSGHVVNRLTINNQQIKKTKARITGRQYSVRRKLDSINNGTITMEMIKSDPTLFKNNHDKLSIIRKRKRRARFCD